MPTQVGIRELLEAGVHFGHQTRRWNPKMRRFIFGERAGIYLIDLLKTEALLAQAQQFADQIARHGGTVLFVGTKKQARDGIKEIAEAAGQPYVNHRWLGGLLTNFQTINQRIRRLHDLERYESEGQLQLLPTRERLSALADLEKLRANLGGVKNMQRVPDAMFVVDLKTEEIAVREAQRLRIPVIGLVDTNCDPDGIAYVIPGNDDAMRACNIITRAIGDVIGEGRARFRAEEEEARRQAEEQSRREAEEKARRDAEEEARKEAEALAAAEALTHGGEGEPRDAAEAAVAEAAQHAGREVEGRRPAEAAAAAQAADEPAVAGGQHGPTTREQHQNPNAGERLPQGAGAPQGEGAPASDTVGAGEEAPAASRARQRARRPRAAAATPRGPSKTAEAAEAEAPADVEAAEAEAAQGAAAVEAAQAEAATGEAPPAAEAAPATEPAPATGEAPAATEAAPATEGDSPTEGLVDRAQDAANQAVDTAQDVAAAAAGAAEGTAEAVAERASGSIEGVAKAAAGAAGAAAEAVANTEDEKKSEENEK